MKQSPLSCYRYSECVLCVFSDLIMLYVHVSVVFLVFFFMCLKVLDCTGKKKLRHMSQVSINGVWTMICTSSLRHPTSPKRTVNNSHCVVYMCIYTHI